MVLGVVAPVVLLGLVELVADPSDQRVASLFVALVAALAVISGMTAAVTSGLSSGVVLWYAAFPPRGFGVEAATLFDLAAFAVAVALVVVLIWRLDAAVRDARASASLLSSFVDTAPLGIAVFDHDLRFTRINEALAAMNARPGPDHLGRRMRDLFDYPHVPELERRMAQVLETGEPVVDLEIVSPRPDDRSRIHAFRVSMLPLADREQPSEVAILVEDVTPQRDADHRSAVVTECARQLATAATTEEAARRLATVLARTVAPDVVVALQGDHDELVVAATASTGPRSADELADDRFQTWCDAVGRPVPTDSALAHAVRAGGTDSRHVTIGADAETGATATTVPLIVDRDDEPLGAMELRWRRSKELDEGDHDLHQAVATLAAAALARIRAVEQANQDLFRKALDAMLDDVAIGRAVRDDTGRIVDFVIEHANSRSRDGAGRGADEMVGRPVTELYPSWVDSGMLAAFATVVDTGEPLVADELPYEDVTPDGVPITGWWRLQVVPFGDGYLATSRDITAQVHLREQARRDAERAQRERIAVDLLQTAALPSHLPAVTGLEVAATYVAATTETPVGGDWYDAFETEDGRIALLVGDVAGHGRESAVPMLQARSLLHALALRGGDPGEALGETNRLLSRLWKARTFATVLVCLLDPRTGSMTTARAGHPPPVAGTTGGVTDVAVPGGPPLGVVADAVYPSSVTSLVPGAPVVLYSDGLVESRTRPIDDGISALVTLVEAEAALGADALCRRIVEAIADDARVDDMCVVVGRRSS